MNLKDKIEEVAILVQRLDRAFTFYFTGFEKKPPLKMYERLQREVKKLHDVVDGLKNSAERFTVQTLLSRFASYRIKWDRGMRDIEEGRIRPGAAFFGGVSKDPKRLVAGEEGTGTAAPDLDEIARGAEKMERLDAQLGDAAKRYVALARAHLGKVYDPAAIKQTLEASLPEVRRKYGDEVDFEVYFDGDKVRVRPRSLKG
ncbi:MAG TPA: hypothetical protein PKH10_06265 [bacterium]|nr:hypothetical protein [bacterium]